VDDPTYPKTGNIFQGYLKAVGSDPNFVEYYQDSWSQVEPVAPPGEPIMFAATNALTQGDNTVPVISWGTNAIPLEEILAGDYNNYIDSSATQVKEYPGPVFIRLDWEMNGAWSGWNPANQPTGTTPATFVAFWRYVVTRFRADGVTNANWIWSPNVDDGDSSMDSYYPGASYVNLVGLDAYNKGDFPWASFGQIFQSSYDEITSLAPGIPVMISETATLEATPAQAARGYSKAQWIQQMASYIPTNMPAVRALCWYEQPVGNQDFSVESSPTSLAAWQRYVVGNPTYQGRLT
jgi:beta-mannanase